MGRVKRADSRAVPNVMLSTGVAFVGLIKFSNCYDRDINCNRNAQLSDTMNEYKRLNY